VASINLIMEWPIRVDGGLKMQVSAALANVAYTSLQKELFILL
jgi:hypothetical protein